MQMQMWSFTYDILCAPRRTPEMLDKCSDLVEHPENVSRAFNVTGCQFGHLRRGTRTTNSSTSNSIKDANDEEDTTFWLLVGLCITPWVLLPFVSLYAFSAYRARVFESRTKAEWKFLCRSIQQEFMKTLQETAVYRRMLGYASFYQCLTSPSFAWISMQDQWSGCSLDTVNADGKNMFGTGNASRCLSFDKDGKEYVGEGLLRYVDRHDTTRCRLVRLTIIMRQSNKHNRSMIHLKVGPEERLPVRPFRRRTHRAGSRKKSSVCPIAITAERLVHEHDLWEVPLALLPMQGPYDFQQPEMAIGYFGNSSATYPELVWEEVALVEFAVVPAAHSTGQDGHSAVLVSMPDAQAGNHKYIGVPIIGTKYAQTAANKRQEEAFAAAAERMRQDQAAAAEAAAMPPHLPELSARFPPERCGQAATQIHNYAPARSRNQARTTSTEKKFQGEEAAAATAAEKKRQEKAATAATAEQRWQDEKSNASSSAEMQLDRELAEELSVQPPWADALHQSDESCDFDDEPVQLGTWSPLPMPAVRNTFLNYPIPPPCAPRLTRSESPPFNRRYLL